MTLGFSEHAPHPDPFPGGRLDAIDFPGYQAAVLAARIANPDMRIPLGLECEWSPDLKQWYLDFGCDYLVGSVHVYGSSETMASYTSKVIDTIESRMFAFIAHPDQFWFEHKDWTHEVERCAEAILLNAFFYDVPLEINGNRAPAICAAPPGEVPHFWQMAAEFGCRVVINSDAHNPDHICQHYDLMEDMRVRAGLKLAKLEIPNG